MKKWILCVICALTGAYAQAQKPVNKADSVLKEKYKVDTPKIKGDTMHYPRQDSIIRQRPGQSSIQKPKQPKTAQKP